MNKKKITVKEVVTMANGIVRRTSNPLSVTRDFDTLFDSLWNTWGVPAVRFPAVDVWEDEKAYVLEAELPGYSEKDIDVHIDNHVLKISSVAEAEKETKEEKQGNYLIKERVYRSFERSFTLPEGIDEGNIQAKFNNGVLKITMPKLPEKQPKKIDIKITK